MFSSKLLKVVIDQLERTSGFVTLTSLLVDRDDHNQSALHLAVMNGNYEITELLIKHKSEVDAKRYGMTTSLHIAAANGNIDIVKLLIWSSANIEERNSQGETALHAAAVMNREEVVSFLLEKWVFYLLLSQITTDMLYSQLRIFRIGFIQTFCIRERITMSHCFRIKIQFDDSHFPGLLIHIKL